MEPRSCSTSAKVCSQARWKLIIDSGLRRHINSTQPHRQVRQSPEMTPTAWSHLAWAAPDHSGRTSWPNLSLRGRTRPHICFQIPSLRRGRGSYDIWHLTGRQLQSLAGITEADAGFLFGINATFLYYIIS